MSFLFYTVCINSKTIFSNIKNLIKKVKKNYKFYENFINNSFELKDQNDFLVPIN